MVKGSRTEPPTVRRRGTRQVAAAAGGLLVVAMLGTACASDADSTSAARIVAPPMLTSAASTTDARPAGRTTSVHWNEVARTLVASHNTNGPLSSRVYALVSVAQFLASIAADGRGDDHGHSRKHGDRDGGNVDAAIVRASANVLSGLHPDAASAAVIAAAVEEDQRASDGHAKDHGGAAAGDTTGAKVAEAVLARAATDRAAAANCPATPPLPPTQFWHDDATPPNPQPVLPCFGAVRTWLGLDVTQFRADPPPAFGSSSFLAGLAEVRQISDTRTAAQLAIVDAWLDGNNTFQPPGRWNLIASDLVTQHHLDASKAARVFAVLNIAMMDTHVACWDRKYVYWELRPWMADPLITTPRGQPHHPSNPSGHACAGGAGSGALAGLFPSRRDALLALGNEQGFSTVLAGTHYRFDVDKGLEIGRAIAARALAVRHLESLLEGSDRH